MARTWLSIRVEVVEGRAELLWPRPGRVFAAATTAVASAVSPSNAS